MKADKQLTRRIILLSSLVYMISYVTRSNYSAVISEMVTSTGLSKSALSIALTGSFITYGAGQLISGWFGDRVQPRILIALGLAATGCMNLLIPLCSTPGQMAIVWCCNGLAQAFMWPPIFVGIALWLPFCPNIELKPTKRKTETKSAGLGAVLLPLILVMTGIMMQGILRDGVTTWMPSYIAETFHLSNEISILAGVILPIFTILCYSWANYLYLKVKNPVVCALGIFSAAALASGLLYGFCGASPVFSVALSAVITGCMHGVNLMLNGISPTFFAKNGNVGLISGLLNSCTYVGSAISAWLIPLASEAAGWNAAIGVWFLVALVGVLVMCLALVPFKKIQCQTHFMCLEGKVLEEGV